MLFSKASLMLLTSLARSLFELVDIWYRRDRVRVSPYEGRFWHLQPGNLLMIDDQFVEVVSRIVRYGNALTLSLICQTADETGCLIVSSKSEQQTIQLFWITAAGTRELQITDVQIWS